VSRRYVIASVAALCLALVACQATSDPPIAEWSVEPSNAPHDPARAGGGGGRSAALTSARGSGAVVLPGNGRFIGSGRGGKPEAPEPGEEDVTLNLANLPIAQAVKVVLGDILGANYVVDPRLDGKITVHTTKPVTKAAALELFQSALRLSGAAVVQAGGVYKVVPLDQAATAGADISTSANDSPSHSAAEGVRIIQLHYVAPSEIRRLLEPMTAQGTVLQADDNRHTITLKGTPQDVASLEDVIATFDIDTMRGMSFALVPVKSGDPDTMAEDLRKVFGSDDKEGPMKDMVRFVSNKRLQSILVISAQRAYLERAQAWIQRLDARAQGTEKQFFTYRVQNRPAKEMLQVLSSMFGEGSKGSDGNTAPRFGQSSSSSGSDSSALGSSSAGSSSPLGALSASGPTGGAGGLGGGAGGLGGAGGSASPGGAGGMGGQVGGPGGSPGFFGSAGNGPNDQSQSKGPTSVSLGADNRYKVGVDEAKNSLVVMATPEDYKRILHVIEALDVQPNQVFIEATIAEVTLTDELHFGVAWFLQQRSHAAGWGGLGPSAAAAIANNPLGNNNILGNNVVGVPLQSLFPGFS
jgi:general secretion pathway protein D